MLTRVWVLAPTTLIFLLCTVLIQAADTLPPAPFSPLVLPGGKRLDVERAYVQVNGRMVSITALISNPSRMQRTGMLTFELPMFGWEGGANDYFRKDFPELQVRVNSRPVKPSRVVTAFANGRDVTEELLRHGLDPLAVATDMLSDDFAASLDTQAINQLVKSHILLQQDNFVTPAWRVAVRYQWEQTFLAKAVTRVNWQYELNPGFDIQHKDDVASTIAHFCDKKMRLTRKLKQIGVQPEYFLPEEYVIPLTQPAPAAVFIRYKAEPQDATWNPFFSAACFDRQDVLSLGRYGFSAQLGKVDRIQFGVFSYQNP